MIKTIYYSELRVTILCDGKVIAVVSANHARSMGLLK